MDGSIALSVDAGLEPLLAALGLDDESASQGDPVTLGDGLCALVADPWDVPVLVERGVVDCGVVAAHILAEVEVDVVRILDLGIAGSRLALVTSDEGAELPRGRRPRVATTHPRAARRYFARRGTQVEILSLRRAADVTVALDHADAAVVTVAAGEQRTVRGLVVREDVLASTARLIVNRSARIVRAVEVRAVVERVLAAAAEAGGRPAARKEPHAVPRPE